VERCEIRAPFTGRVREERVDVGQFVSRGERIARLYAIDVAEVRLPISDDELAFVDLPLLYRGDEEARPGPEVELSARFAGERHVWRARVVRTEGEIDPRTRMVNVVARVEDPYERSNGRPPLAVGLFVDAEILGRTVEDVVVLPRAALREGDVVHVVDAEDRLRLRPVSVLRRHRDEVVLASGLAPGERVSVTPLAAPVDGMLLKPLALEESGS
jgi:multidrug efflux pump subunit AcrA (membrane-fusion protein)